MIYNDTVCAKQCSIGALGLCFYPQIYQPLYPFHISWNSWDRNISTNQTIQPTLGCYFWGWTVYPRFIHFICIYTNICWQSIFECCFVVFTLILAISRKAVSVGFGKPSLKQVTLEWRVAWKLTITTWSDQHTKNLTRTSRRIIDRLLFNMRWYNK